MRIHQDTITVSTPERESFVDITGKITRYVKEQGVQKGMIHLFVPHTTAGVTINENADPDVCRDLLFELKKSFPDRKEFRHAEGNSDAHIKSSLIGPNLTVPIQGGKLRLGTWQGIYFTEFDGPRDRKLHVQIIGE